MKKLILLLIVCAALFSGELTQQQKDLAGRLVEIKGYSCKKVDNAIRSNWDGSITVYCDNHSYHYEVKNVGGRWQVKVK